MAPFSAVRWYPLRCGVCQHLCCGSLLISTFFVMPMLSSVVVEYANTIFCCKSVLAPSSSWSMLSSIVVECVNTLCVAECVSTLFRRGACNTLFVVECVNTLFVGGSMLLSSSRRCGVCQHPLCCGLLCWHPHIRSGVSTLFRCGVIATRLSTNPAAQRGGGVPRYQMRLT